MGTFIEINMPVEKSRVSTQPVIAGGILLKMHTLTGDSLIFFNEGFYTPALY